jgi:Flp pilus assembly protein TadB
MFEQDSVSRKAVVRVFYAIFTILGVTVMLVAWAKVNPIATVTVLSVMVLPILGTWVFLNRRNRRLGKTG